MLLMFSRNYLLKYSICSEFNNVEHLAEAHQNKLGCLHMIDLGVVSAFGGKAGVELRPDERET